jgi:cysteine-rich repeat protein
LSRFYASLGKSFRGARLAIGLARERGPGGLRRREKRRMFRPLARLSFAIACLVALPAAASAEVCTVTFGFSGDLRVSGAVVEVNYARSGHSFVGSGADVECHAVAPGVLATFNDEHDVVSAALIRVEPFGGSRLFACSVSGDDIAAEDFEVATVDASDSNSDTVAVLPKSVVSSVECGSVRSPEEEEQFCDVVFTMDAAQRVSGLTYEADYGSAGVDPVGFCDEVHCKTLLTGALGAYTDEEFSTSLVGAFVDVAGAEGTLDISSCRFAAPNGFQAADLDIEVIDAVGPDGESLAVRPAVFVGEVTCGTAAELQPEEGDDGGEGRSAECDGDYEVTFAVGGNAHLGALQVAVGYSGAPGGFAGANENAACSADVDGLAMFNDKEGVKTLKAGIVSTSGFDAPRNVFTCTFESVGRAPTANDFVVEVEDASHTDGSDVEPVPTAHVAAIVPSAGNACADSEPRCGNGVVETEEECDDGNDGDDDGCFTNCSAVSCGDIDGSGELTATDARRVLRDAVGIGDECTLVRCDVNTTGTVTATDARMVLNASIGLDQPLACAWALDSGL